LHIEGLKAGYGDVPVLMGITLRVQPNEMVAVVGPNGAGKSTLLKCISGLIPLKEGEISFGEMKISGLGYLEIVQKGIIHCPEGGKVFPEMKVEDNLLVGGYRFKKEPRKRQLHFVYTLFPKLEQRRKQLAGTLSGGERQMVALGLALMSQPTLLMMDEPSLGLAPLVKQAIFKTIDIIKREQKISILLVEQDAFSALELASRSYVLDNGRIAMQAQSKDLLQNSEFKRIYMGL
jgi:branched-chain amino acid transport system ATP-binding protein